MNYRPGEIIFSDDDKEIDRLSKKYLEAELKISEKIQGRIAFPGRIVAEVCIVRDKKDFKKMRKGKILVTFMTTPDFVQIMKMSSAIITDEGGITCHAAIIARELQTPCIIGTKIATRALKDGDLVEVDVDKGVIKVIKKYVK